MIFLALSASQHQTIETPYDGTGTARYGFHISHDALMTENQVLQTENEGYRRDNAHYRTQIATLQRDLASLHGENAELRIHSDMLLERLRTAEGRSAAIQGENEALQRQLERGRGENAELQRQLRAVQDRSAEFQRGNTDLLRQLELVRGADAVLRGQFDQLQRQADQLQAGNQRLSLDLNESSRSIIHLSKTAVEAIINNVNHLGAISEDFPNQIARARSGGNPQDLVKIKFYFDQDKAGYLQDIEDQVRNGRNIVTIQDLDSSGNPIFLIALNTEEKRRIFGDGNDFVTRQSTIRHYRLLDNVDPTFDTLNRQLASYDATIPEDVISAANQQRLLAQIQSAR